MEYRDLGQTGWKVSGLSFGHGELAIPAETLKKIAGLYHPRVHPPASRYK